MDWRTTWSRVCSSAPHYQAAEEAIHERKRPTSVRSRLSRTHAVLGKVIPGGWVPVSGMKVRRVIRPFRIPLVIPQSAARMLLFTDKLMSCCAAGTNGCLDLRRHAFALGGQVNAECSMCLGSMARRAIETVCGSIATRLSRLDACDEY